MKLFKKLGCVALSAAMIASLAACGSSSKKSTSIEAVTVDDFAAALEDAGLEKLTWDDYWWENGTFYVSDSEDKVGGTGANGNDYELEIYADEETAKAAYESSTSYIISMAEAYDIDLDNVEEDDYAYLTASEEGEGMAYYWAGNSVLSVTTEEDGMDEANDILSAIGYPEL